MVRYTFRNVCFKGVWSNGYGERMQDTIYVFERLTAGMKTELHSIGSLQMILEHIQEGDFDPESKYRIKPLQKQRSNPGDPYMMISRKQRELINNMIALVIVKS